MVSLFTRKYLTFSLIIILVFAVPVIFFFDKQMQLGIAVNFIVFFLLVYISGILLSGSVRVNNAKFFRNLLISMTLKMFIGIVYFLLMIKYVEVFKSNLVIFITSFFLAYFIFTIFEVVFLVRRFKEISEKAKEL